MRKKVYVKISDAEYIEIEGKVVLADPEIAESLPRIFSA